MQDSAPIQLSFPQADMTPTPTKRKSINDFFMPVAKRPSLRDTSDCLKSSPKAITTPMPSKPQGTAVPGLTLHQEFITPAEEQRILAFLNDPFQCTWRTDLSRRTMHFGDTYCLMPPKTSSSNPPTPQIIQAPPIPSALSWLIQRMVSTGVFASTQIPQYCIINEYTGHNGISAHTESFQFAEPVVGLSLLSACPIRFHELTQPFDGSVRSGKAAKAERTGRREDVLMPGRCLMVMRGESRWKWQHEIMRSRRGRGVGWKRVSLTFRWKPGEESSLGLE